MLVVDDECSAIGVMDDEDVFQIQDSVDGYEVVNEGFDLAAGVAEDDDFAWLCV